MQDPTNPTLPRVRNVPMKRASHLKCLMALPFLEGQRFWIAGLLDKEVSGF